MLTACLRERSAVTALFPLTYKEKYRDENCDYSGCNAPVYQTAQVGKMPIGKAPIGKTPIGKAPVGTRVY